VSKKLLGTLELNRIYQRDCLEGLRMLPDESCDLVITSPPYNIGKMHSNQIQFGTYSGNDMKEEDYQVWQTEILNECHRILKPTGSMFYNHKVRINKGVAIHPLEWIFNSKFTLKQEITWDMGKSANCDKIRFFPFSERIYWLTKSPKTKLYNEINLSDVWRVVPTHKRKDTKHIAVMPEEIVDNILRCVEGQIVVEPFCGSGTTPVVAQRHGRDWIAFELNPEYIENANKRLDNEEETK
jgi:modification methylase